jgi:hypothetical protein
MGTAIPAAGPSAYLRLPQLRAHRELGGVEGLPGRAREPRRITPHYDLGHCPRGRVRCELCDARYGGTAPRSWPLPRGKLATLPAFRFISKEYAFAEEGESL